VFLLKAQDAGMLFKTNMLDIPTYMKGVILNFFCATGLFLQADEI